jgi:predicted glycosyltransferase
VLLLRDILDAPSKVCEEWQTKGYYQAIQEHYDQIAVVGTPDIFDMAQEYQFPLPVARKVKYCGYIRKIGNDRSPVGEQSPKRSEIRRFLRLKPDEKLVLVTPGGGEDGFPIVEAYLKGVATCPDQFRSLILCGPEMPAAQQQILQQMTGAIPSVDLQVFTDDLLGYLDAADAVVAMGGYNTITEVLSLNKRTVVVPRISPSHEQLIRTERLEQLGLVRAIHPDQLTPQSLLSAVCDQLQQPPLTQTLNFDGLPQLTVHLSELVMRSPLAPFPAMLTV